MKIDVFTHFLPIKYVETVRERAPEAFRRMGKVMQLSALVDVEARLRVTEPFPNYRQGLTSAGVPQSGMPPQGVPVDDPRFAPFFARMAEYDLPIWLHPTRRDNFPDYLSEDRSRYNISHIF